MKTEAESLTFYREAYDKCRVRCENLERDNTRLYEAEARHTVSYGHACMERDSAIRALSEGAHFALTSRNADSLDAERYRYLRNVAGQIAADDDGPMVCDGLGDNFDYLRGVEVDESVDAAMALWKAAGCPLPKEAA